MNNLEPRIKSDHPPNFIIYFSLFFSFFSYSIRVSNFHLLAVDASHLISAKRVVTFIQGLQAMTYWKDEEHNEREANIMPEIAVGSWIVAC